MLPGTWVAWVPARRAERNLHAEHSAWQVVRTDKAGNVLIVPVDRSGHQRWERRIWIGAAQVITSAS